MVSTYTANKRIEQPGFNDFVDTWDVPVNNDWAIIDLALGGSVSINTTGLSGNVTLSSAQYQPLKIVLTGAPTTAINYRVPSGVGGIWVVRNNTTGGMAVTVDSIAGGSAVTIPAGQNTLVTCDGSASGMFLAINTSPVAAGSNTQVQYNNAGVLGGSANFTFDGSVLAVTNLQVLDTTVLGGSVGDTIVVNAGTASIPNGLNIGSNNLYLSGTKAGIGTATLGAEMLTVAGVVYATAGGFKFPDGTTQTSAAAVVAGSNTQIQYNDGGVFGAKNTFTFTKGTNTLALSGTFALTGSATVSGTVTGGIVATSGSLTGVTINGATNTITNVSLTTGVTGILPRANGGFTPSNLSNALGADITMSDVSLYYDGPTVAQGTSGLWYVSGSITLGVTAGNPINVKLWDGTTVIASGEATGPTVTGVFQIHLSGIINAPTGNLRISARSPAVGATMYYDVSGNAKDSNITAFRIG